MLPKGVGEVGNHSEWERPLPKGKYDKSATWRMQANEAIVIFGQTPPEMRYWSSTNQLFSRYNENADGIDPRGTRYIACPKPPARCDNFASVDNSYNHLTLNLTADPVNTVYAERCDGEECVKVPSFNSNFAIVLANSEVVAEEVKEDLVMDGIIDSANILPFPGAELKLSTDSWGENDDTLNWLFRLALPKNQEEYDEYCKLAEEQKLIKVFRVTATPDAEKDLKLYSRPELKSRLLGHPERSDKYSHQELLAG